MKWLEDFISLSATSSFSRSAAERHVTQSALSRRIRQLEAWLDVPLFDRRTHPVRLTPEGQAFLPRARDVVETLRQSRDDLRQHHDNGARTLNFATLNTLSVTFFPPWIRQMEERLGPLKTRFCDQKPSFAATVGVLLAGESDFLLTYAHDWVPSMRDLAACEHRSLGHERIIPVSAPDPRGRARHVIADQAGTSSQPVQYLSYGDQSFFGHGLARLFLEKPLRRSIVYENAMSAGLKAMVLAGHGLAWIPESLIGAELQSGALVQAATPSWNLLVEIRLYRLPAPRRPEADRFWTAVPDQRDIARAHSA